VDLVVLVDLVDLVVLEEDMADADRIEILVLGMVILEDLPDLREDGETIREEDQAATGVRRVLTRHTGDIIFRTHSGVFEGLTETFKLDYCFPRSCTFGSFR